MKRGKLVTWGLAAALVLLTLPALAAEQAVDVQLAPERVQITTFYDGADLKVSGTAPDGEQVAIRLSNEPREAAFRVKGQLWGFLWMNQGEVIFHGLPTVNLYQASGVPEANFHLGLKALRSQAKIEAGAGDPDQLFEEFMKIKQGEGLYSFSPQGVTLGPAQGGSRTFESEFHLPPRLPKGEYRVQVYLRDAAGQITPGPQRQLMVEEVGFPALMSSLAFNYSLLYGVLASLVALLGGLITSLLFKGGGGAH
ncbi:MAG: TIGR02186 family protein [Deltaproteobacteria bacterium]|nr:TIGR02186 family protein [Deltaproteobacteria bacterium]